MPRAALPLLLAAVTSLAACTGTTGLPSPACAAPQRAPADFGTPAQLSPTSSVNLEISGLYVGSKVRKLLEKELPATATDQELAVAAGQPNYIPASGVTVQGVSLKQQTAGATVAHLLEIRISPWLRSAQPDPQHAGVQTLTKAAIPRNFLLRLNLAPRLITAATVPDPARRRALLQCAGNDPACGSNGVIVPFELAELYDVSNSEVVSCTSPTVRSANYDMVAQPVHQGVLDALYGTATSEGAAPLVLPAQVIVDLVSGIAGSPVQLTGIALGTDQNLVVGFLMDRGAPMPFSSDVGFGHFGQPDWGVLIDTSFIGASIRKKITDATAPGTATPVALGPITVAFAGTSPSNNLMTVDASGNASALGCTVPVEIHVAIAPMVRRNAAGRSVIIADPQQTATPHPNFCIIFKSLVFGKANATVCTQSPCTVPPPNPCPEMAQVQFAASPGDTFYGVGMETNGSFYIAGRSTFADSVRAAQGLPPRPPVPTCP